MSRSISMREALDAGLGDSPALGPLTDGLTFHLWRSRPGYRKACRMLRRLGARRQALGRAILGVEMKPKDARRALGILLDPFYFSHSPSAAETVFPMRPVEREAEHQEVALEVLEDGLRSGRLAIVDAEVTPVPCSSPEEGSSDARRQAMAVSLRMEEWLPERPREFLVDGFVGLDLATGPDEIVEWTFGPQTGYEAQSAQPAPKSALVKLLDGLPDEQPAGDVDPPEPEDYVAMFDEE